jgi:hypothetical protein
MNGSLTLREHPGDLVRTTCEKCGRAGRYPKATLIERFGTDIALPDLRHEVAPCDRRGAMHDPCRAHHVGLTTTTRQL